MSLRPKSILKATGHALGACLAVPTLLRHRLMTPVLGQEQAFRLAAERIALKPGLLGLYARQAFYRQTLAHVGADVHFGWLSVVTKSDAWIGDRVYLGRGCGVGRARIEASVMLADGVQVLSGRHQHGSSGADGSTPVGRASRPSEQTALQDQPQHFEQVAIGRGAWIGASAVVMADVGGGAIVAAGAVVVTPVEARSTVAGVPARPVRQQPEAAPGLAA